jgi:hypothetical protein
MQTSSDTKLSYDFAGGDHLGQLSGGRARFGLEANASPPAEEDVAHRLGDPLTADDLAGHVDEPIGGKKVAMTGAAAL